MEVTEQSTNIEVDVPVATTAAAAEPLIVDDADGAGQSSNVVQAFNLKHVVADQDLLKDWEAFQDSKLRPILDHQMMGSYQHPNNLSDMQVMYCCVCACVWAFA